MKIRATGFADLTGFRAAREFPHRAWEVNFAAIRAF
jgi:hypothetical protein